MLVPCWPARPRPQSAAIAVLVTLLGCASARESRPSSTSGAAAARNDYGDDASWLCRPGRRDACSTDVSATIVGVDGKQVVERDDAAREAPIDCFYVYPTVSRDPTPNSDMEAGPEERRAAQVQFARFGSVCRLFAPMYRQVTLAALVEIVQGRPSQADRALAYGDVLAAWNDYLARDNHGRGVVLIGHSQGARIVTELLRNAIEGSAIGERIVSALVIGSNFTVAGGTQIGGSLRHMPLCRSSSQTGCVIAYVSFRASAPPPPNSIFGRGGANVVACTNPAALAGGAGVLRSYFPARGNLLRSEGEPYPWTTGGAPIATPFVSVPGLLTAECVNRGGASYLEITAHPADDARRTRDVPGDLVVDGKVLGGWGLHLVDVNLALGNLVDVVGEQAQAYLARKGSGTR